jgi:hypothetical protein
MKYLYLSLISFSLLGCNSFPASKQVLDSGGQSISIETALTSIGAGLNGMQTAKGDHNFGLLTHKIDVTFNLSISSSDAKNIEGKVNGDASVGVTGSTTASNENSQQSTNERQNSNSNTSQADTGKAESAGSGKSTSTSDIKNKVDSTSTTNQGAKVGGSLVVTTADKLEASKANSITISFLSIPAMVATLDKDRLEFLKNIGYFSDTQKVGTTFFSAISKTIPKEVLEKILKETLPLKKE